MSDKISVLSAALSRRNFLKLMVGAGIIAADLVTAGHILGAPTSVNITGYGSGRYGAGKYGKTSNRYSIFLPAIRK